MTNYTTRIRTVPCHKEPDMTYTVELAINRNGKFAGWQIFEGFLNKRLAWDFIKSHGYTHAEKDICWMAYPE